MATPSPSTVAASRGGVVCVHRATGCTAGRSRRGRVGDGGCAGGQGCSCAPGGDRAQRDPRARSSGSPSHRRDAEGSGAGDGAHGSAAASGRGRAHPRRSRRHRTGHVGWRWRRGLASARFAGSQRRGGDRLVAPSTRSATSTEAKVYLHWTAWDGLPLSILEAMANDVVVIASDIPANRELSVPSRSSATSQPPRPPSARSSATRRPGFTA